MMSLWCSMASMWRGVFFVQLISTILSIFLSSSRMVTTSVRKDIITFLGIPYTSLLEECSAVISEPSRSVFFVVSLYNIGKSPSLFSIILLSVIPVFDFVASLFVKSLILNPAIKSSSSASSSLDFC